MKISDETTMGSDETANGSDLLKDDPLLERRCTSFLRCLQLALGRHLCPGCVDKYWNAFRRQLVFSFTIKNKESGDKALFK